MANQAFQLRKATTDDFSIFYNFHVHHCYHWLFHDEIAIEEDNPFDTETSEDDFEDNYFFSREDLNRIHQEIVGFNIHDFEKHQKWYRIFMIIVDGNVVGYVKLENYCRKFIIREWTMHFEYLKPELLDALLKKFESLTPIKSKAIQVIAMGKVAEELLIRHGYSGKIKPFFEKQIL
ncbi:MAG: hypothetical protein IJW20_03095 [Clostridia bacterium]|nr:hypothetical protein [Clostridia bacterium]